MKTNVCYQGDCLEIMKEFDDKSIDLVLVDPPYGIGIANKTTLSIKGSSNVVKSFTKKEWDSFIPTKEYFDEIIRISKNQIIWGGNYFAHLLPPTSCYLVWWKKDGLPRGTFADCEIAWTSFKKPSQVYNSRWHGFIRDSKEKRLPHPTQKALDVINWCVEEFTKENDIILDCFAGSGTTLESCKNNNRKFIGIEIDNEYCEIITKRTGCEIIKPEMVEETIKDNVVLEQKVNGVVLHKNICECGGKIKKIASGRVCESCMKEY